jgi:hypothetical protein
VAANGAKGSKRSVLQPGHRAQSLQLSQSDIRPNPVDRLQLGDWFTSISDHERPALADLLQVTTEAGLQFAGANSRTSSHVVMMTTWRPLVNHLADRSCC